MQFRQMLKDHDGKPVTWAVDEEDQAYNIIAAVFDQYELYLTNLCFAWAQKLNNIACYERDIMVDYYGHLRYKNEVEKDFFFIPFIEGQPLKERMIDGFCDTLEEYLGIDPTPEEVFAYNRSMLGDAE